MTATLVVETERWDAAEQLLPPAKAEESEAQTGGNSNPMQAYVVVAQIPAICARGLAAAATGSVEAQTRMTELRAIREKASGTPEPLIAFLLFLGLEILDLAIVVPSPKEAPLFAALFWTQEKADIMTVCAVRAHYFCNDGSGPFENFRLAGLSRGGRGVFLC